MDADDHAFIQHIARVHEHATAVLQVPQRVGDCFAVVLRNEHAVATLRHGAGHRAVVVEHVAGQTGAAGQGQEFALEADQATRRNAVLDAHATLAVRLHVGHFAAAATQLFHHAALVTFFDIHREHFVRLALHAVDVLEHHARAADRQFVAFTAHVFQQDGQVQFAATGHQENVRVVGVFDAQRHVLQQFLFQALADLAAGDELAFATGQRRAIHHEVHGQRRLVHRDRLHRLGRFRITDGDTDIDLLDAGHQHDVAGAGRFGLRAVETLEGEHLADLGLAAVLVAVIDDHFLVRLDAAALDAADAQLTDVGRVVERTDLQLQRRVLIHFRLRHVLQDGVEQRAHVGARLVGIQHREAVQCRGEHDREVELFVGGTQLVEQIEGVVDHPVRACARAVDLVHHDDGLQAESQRLAGDEAGLRHRAFDRVDQQQHRIDHRQHALDLAAEVGVARGVDDVDVRAFVFDRAVLGENRDAAFFFDIAGIHDPLGHLLVRCEGAGLAQQLVNQRGLAMIDVRDDGDVAYGAGHGNGATQKINTRV